MLSIDKNSLYEGNKIIYTKLILKLPHLMKWIGIEQKLENEYNENIR